MQHHTVGSLAEAQGPPPALVSLPLQHSNIHFGFPDALPLHHGTELPPSFPGVGLGASLPPQTTANPLTHAGGCAPGGVQLFTSEPAAIHAAAAAATTAAAAQASAADSGRPSSHGPLPPLHLPIAKQVGAAAVAAAGGTGPTGRQAGSGEPRGGGAATAGGKALAPPPGKKPRAKKDPGAPRRPKSAYMFFLADFREHYRAENPATRRVAELGVAAGEAWAKLDPARRAEYERLSTASKAEYAAANAAYLEEHPRPLRRPRVERKPEEMRRPRGGYIHFLADFREEYRKQHPKARASLMSRVGGERWKDMSEDERRPYEELSKIDKDDYARKKQAARVAAAASSAAAAKQRQQQRQQQQEEEGGLDGDGDGGPAVGAGRAQQAAAGAGLMAGGKNKPEAFIGGASAASTLLPADPMQPPPAATPSHLSLSRMLGGAGMSGVLPVTRLSELKLPMTSTSPAASSAQQEQQQMLLQSMDMNGASVARAGGLSLLHPSQMAGGLSLLPPPQSSAAALGSFSSDQKQQQQHLLPASESSMWLPAGVMMPHGLALGVSQGGGGTLHELRMPGLVQLSHPPVQQQQQQAEYELAARPGLVHRPDDLMLSGVPIGTMLHQHQLSPSNQQQHQQLQALNNHHPNQHQQQQQDQQGVYGDTLLLSLQLQHNQELQHLTLRKPSPLPPMSAPPASVAAAAALQQQHFSPSTSVATVPALHQQQEIVLHPTDRLASGLLMLPLLEQGYHQHHFHHQPNLLPSHLVPTSMAQQLGAGQPLEHQHHSAPGQQEQHLQPQHHGAPGQQEQHLQHQQHGAPGQQEQHLQLQHHGAPGQQEQHLQHQHHVHQQHNHQQQQQQQQQHVHHHQQQHHPPIGIDLAGLTEEDQQLLQLNL